jgi:hypothetical protein
MIKEKQNPIIISRNEGPSVFRFKPGILRIVLFIIWGLIAVNVSGCATMSLWEKKPTVAAKASHTRYADLNNILILEAPESPQEQGRIYLRFKAKPSIMHPKTFPPVTEGYLVLLPGTETKTLIKRINGLQSVLKPNESLYISKVTVYRISDDADGIKNTVSLEIIRRYGNGGKGIYRLGSTPDGRLRAVNIKFEETLSQMDGKPIPVNIDMSSAGLSFVECSRRISVYKNPSAIGRIAGTPFAVAIDIATSPLQLIAILTVPLWMPR